jgi:hypothetical protein
VNITWLLLLARSAVGGGVGIGARVAAGREPASSPIPGSAGAIKADVAGTGAAGAAPRPSCGGGGTRGAIAVVASGGASIGACVCA